MVANGKLYSDIMDALDFDPRLDAKEITISIKDPGIVTLAGIVKSFAEKHIAEEIVKKVKGVNAIANEILVDASTIYKRSDAEIAKSAITALSNNYFVPKDRIKVIVDNGILTLSGDVEHYFQKEEAKNAVRNLFGIRNVIDNIAVKPSVSPIDIKEKIIREFERNARIDAANIKVLVDGGEVILEGKVRNFDEDKEARFAAWSVPGVNKVIDRLEIGYY